MPNHYVVGLRGVGWSYDPNSNGTAGNVRSLRMSLEHGQRDQNSIYVTVRGRMEDDHGLTSDGLTSGDVVVIAWVGSADTPTVAMQNLTGVSSANPQNIVAPSGVVRVCTFLAGLRLELPSTQPVTSWSASCEANASMLGDGSYNITGGSRLNGVEGTVDVGVLVLTDPNAPFQILTGSSNDDHPIQANFQPAVDQAHAVMISFSRIADGSPLRWMQIYNDTDSQTTFPANSVTMNCAVDITTKGGGFYHNGNLNALLIGLNSSH